MGNSSLFSILILVLLFLVMYFLMIRPQKKREKETQAMRSAVQVGDEIITIGGLCAKVVKTKEESLIVQVGADKVKMEIMRWAVSKVVKEGSGHRKSIDDYEDTSDAEAKEQKKAKPRRMKKAATVEKAEEVKEEVAEVKEEPKEEPVAEEPAAPAEEVKEEAKEEAAEDK